MKREGKERGREERLVGKNIKMKEENGEGRREGHERRKRKEDG